MTREDLFSRLKSRRLYDTVFKRRSRNVCATQKPGHRFAVRLAAQIRSYTLCRQSASGRRRSAAPVQRRYELRAPWQPHLPTEVWCAIWACLPFSALIVVTHTCQRWRLAALACPSLWTHPRFYSTITRSPRSSFLTSSEYDSMERTASTGVTNVSCAPDILARSRNLRLYITLDVPPLEPVLDLIQDLGLELSQSSHRIAGITVRATSPKAADALMWDMRSLPALRRLALQTWTPATEVYGGPLYPFMHSDLSAVNLEDVELGPGFYWPRDIPHLPKVRRVLLTVENNLHHDLGTVLDACPALKGLTLDLGSLFCPVWPPEDSVSASLRGRCARLRAVRLMNLSENNSALALSTLHTPALPEISVCASRDSAIRGGAIFRDLRGAVRLAVLHHGGQVTVAASDRDKRARRVSCPVTDSSVQAILPGCIDWRNVVMLSVSASHWFHCVSALPAAPAIKRLRLLMDNQAHGNVLDPIPGLYNPVSTATKFPALRRLDIVGTGGTARMTADDIAAVICALGIGLPLREIGVDHRVLQGSRAALRPLAQKVAIRIYRA